jgi:hypothetical protein
MQQQQYQGPDRRQSQTQSQYQGEERRRPQPMSGMSTQERKEEQEERTRQQAKRYDDTH